MIKSGIRFLLLLAAVGTAILLLHGCGNRGQDLLSSDDKPIIVPLCNLPIGLVDIRETDSGSLTLRQREFTVEELVAFLENQPDSAMASGILFHAKDKTYPSISDFIVQFCVRRNVDLYMIIPTSKVPSEAARWCVRSTRAAP